MYARNLAVALFSHEYRWEEALALMEEAMDIAPQIDQLKLEYLYAANKYGVPGEKRLEIIAHHPWIGRKADDYVLEHARALCLAGRHDEALSVMLDHKFVPAEGGEKAITNLYYAIMLYKGRLAIKVGRTDDALKILLPLTGELPANLHAGLWSETDLVPLYYYQAQALKAAGRQEECLGKYRLALKRFNQTMPELAPCYAGALRALGRGVEARTYLSRLLRSAEDMECLRSIGWEDMTSAFNSFQNAPQRQREGMTAYWKALILICEDRTEEARALLEDSCHLWPENLNAWFELEPLKR